MEPHATGATWHTDVEMQAAASPDPANRDVVDQPRTQVLDDTVGNTARQLAQQAQQQAGHLADQARRQITLQLTSQKERATAGLDSAARAIRETGRQMQGDGQAPIAQAADRAAFQVERVSTFLSQRDINALRDEAERFARRQTPLFLAGAFAAGWLGARFLKSSAPADASGADVMEPLSAAGEPANLAAQRSAYGGQTSPEMYSGSDRQPNGLGRKLSAVPDTAAQLADHTRQGASQLVDKTRQSAGQLGSRARENVLQAQSGIQRLVQDNPLVVGAFVAGLGVMAGLVVPESDKENELLGRAHDALMEQAGQTAQEAVTRVRHTAIDAIH
jgi:ElaB/YqjD/DUF883 family membrane-anchored ribosome-binding protein